MTHLDKKSVLRIGLFPLEGDGHRQDRSVSVMRFLRNRKLGICALIFGVVFVLKTSLLFRFNLEIHEDGFGIVKEVDSILQDGYLGGTKYFLHPLLLAGLNVLLPESVDTSTTGRFFSILLGSTSVVLMYLLVTSLFNQRIALLSAVLLLVSPWAVYNDLSTINASLFLSAYLAFFLFYCRNNWVACSLFACVAGITRYEGIVLILFLFVALIHQARLRRIGPSTLTLSTLLLLLVPLTWILHSYLGTGELFQFIGKQRTNRIAYEILLRSGSLGPRAFQSAYFVVGYYFAITPLVSYLAILGFAWVVKERWERNTKVLVQLFLGYVVFYLILSVFNKVNPEARYLLYPGLTLIVFASYALGRINTLLGGTFKTVTAGRKILLRRFFAHGTLLVINLTPIMVSAWMAYNLSADQFSRIRLQKSVVQELAALLDPGKPHNVVVSRYSGALYAFAKQNGLNCRLVSIHDLPLKGTMSYLIEKEIDYMVYIKNDPRSMRVFPHLNGISEQRKDRIVFRPVASLPFKGSDTSHFSPINKKVDMTHVIYSLERVEPAQGPG